MKHAYDLVIAQTVYLDDLYGGKFVPKDSNPYREAIEFDRIKSDVVKRDDTKTAFALLGRGLAQYKRKRSTKKKD